MKTLIFPNTGNELLRVNIRDVVYVEADGNYCRMYLTGDATQDLWFNMKHFVSIVDEQMSDEEPLFVAVGRSLVINRLYIYRINPVKGELILFGHGCTKMVTLHASQAALTRLREYVQSTEELKCV